MSIILKRRVVYAQLNHNNFFLNNDLGLREIRQEFRQEGWDWTSGEPAPPRPPPASSSRARSNSTAQRHRPSRRLKLHDALAAVSRLPAASSSWARSNSTAQRRRPSRRLKLHDALAAVSRPPSFDFSPVSLPIFSPYLSPLALLKKILPFLHLCQYTLCHPL